VRCISCPLNSSVDDLLSPSQCLLVQGYSSGTSWGFPKGKLESGETDIDAAVREVYEETGFDIRGLVQEKAFLEASIRDTNVRMYLIVGVAENTEFEPKTRNEIKVSQGICSWMSSCYHGDCYCLEYPVVQH
jgi:8-oxo-dGTP pyrophosphatase MutT (NUDIX family)